MEANSPWAVSESEFPYSTGVKEQLRFLLRYAILAPSSHNSQPWRFQVSNNEIRMFRDDARRLFIVDPDGREQTISCGAALFNIRVACHYFGFQPDVAVLPSGEKGSLLATIRLGGRHETSAEERQLFRAILERSTNREPFTFIDVPESVLTEMQDAAFDEGVWLRTVTDSQMINKIGLLVEEADYMQAQDRAFRQELANWVKSDPGAHDGISVETLGMPKIGSYLTTLLLRNFNWGIVKATRDRELTSGSPVLIVLGTESDTAADWIAAGQALEQIQLIGQNHGMSFSFLNQPVEVPVLRRQLAQRLGVNSFPQLVLGLGYCGRGKHSQRRDLEDVLL